MQCGESSAQIAPRLSKLPLPRTILDVSYRPGQMMLRDQQLMM